MKHISKIVAYYRLSKPKKGKNKQETIRDAYGLEDQRQAVHSLAKEHGAEIIGEFSEIETGRKADRPELKKALLKAQMHKATLVIGKQDRLGRNVAFVSSLTRAKVDFVCADRPDQSKFEVHIRACVDEEEADRIADRTKAGMRVAKEKGMKFGFARPGFFGKYKHLMVPKQASAASAKVRHQKSVEAASVVIDLIVQMQAEGVSLQETANRLNELGHVTTRGKPFTAVAVYRILKLCGKKLKPKRPGKAKCAQCGRTFRLSWDQWQQKEDGQPVLCLGERCIKEVNWQSVVDVVHGMEGQTPTQIADALNYLGYRTGHGKPFNEQRVAYVIRLLEPASV